MALYMEDNALSRLYLGCILKDFSETPHFPLKAKDLRFVKTVVIDQV
jgi:hypothetical protein